MEFEYLYYIYKLKQKYVLIEIFERESTWIPAEEKCLYKKKCKSWWWHVFLGSVMLLLYGHFTFNTSSTVNNR